MYAIILLTTSSPAAMNGSSDYLIGAMVGLFLLGYLLYALIKPEKF